LWRNTPLWVTFRRTRRAPTGREVILKKIASFFVTTAIGGIFVLLPVGLVAYLLVNGVLIGVDALQPVAEMFPEDSIWRSPLLVGPILGLLVILVAFLAGLAMRVALVRSAGGWFERMVLMRLPGYKVFKRLTDGFAASLEGEGYKPALMALPGGTKQLVLIVEADGGAEVTVFVPTSPTAAVGMIQRARRDQLELIDAELLDVVDVVSHWGVGLEKLVKAGAKNKESRDAV